MDIVEALEGTGKGGGIMRVSRCTVVFAQSER